jgi:hypothetical protein
VARLAYWEHAAKCRRANAQGGVPSAPRRPAVQFAKGGQAIDTIVVLFNRDLRTHDHPALAEACRPAGTVVPLFVIDPALASRPLASTTPETGSGSRVRATTPAPTAGSICFGRPTVTTPGVTMCAVISGAGRDPRACRPRTVAAWASGTHAAGLPGTDHRPGPARKPVTQPSHGSPRVIVAFLSKRVAF